MVVTVAHIFFTLYNNSSSTKRVALLSSVGAELKNHLTIEKPTPKSSIPYSIPTRKKMHATTDITQKIIIDSIRVHSAAYHQ